MPSFSNFTIPDGAKTLIAAKGAAFTTQAIFHPSKTAITRYQAHQGPMTQWHQTLFPGVKPGITQWPAYLRSCYQGIGAGFIYKVGQTGIKLGSQQWLTDLFTKSSYGQQWRSTYGDHGEAVVRGLAGSAGGILELIVYPLDSLMVKQQATPSLQGIGTRRAMQQIGTATLFNGIGETALRNVQGSFWAFFISQMLRLEMGYRDPRNTPSGLNFACNLGGTAASIGLTAPWDVLKVRKQINPVLASLSMSQLARNIAQNEGMLALWKGAGMKIITAAPRPAVAMTLASYFASLMGMGSSPPGAAPSTPTPANNKPSPGPTPASPVSPRASQQGLFGNKADPYENGMEAPCSAPSLSSEK